MPHISPITVTWLYMQVKHLGYVFDDAQSQVTILSEIPVSIYYAVPMEVSMLIFRTSWAMQHKCMFFVGEGHKIIIFHCNNAKRSVQNLFANSTRAIQMVLNHI